MVITAPFEVLTMGRVGVDVYPLQTGVGLDEVETFGKYLGGSATNVAVATARLGHRSAVITRTGADPFGRFVHAALRGYRVDDRFVTAVPGLPTPVTFCEIFPPDDFPIYFYRYPKAPDLEIRADELDYAAIRAADVFWVTVTGLCAEPSRTATLAALEARGKAGVTVLDLDYRPAFWPSREEAREWVQAALGHVTVAVGQPRRVRHGGGRARPGPGGQGPARPRRRAGRGQAGTGRRARAGQLGPVTVPPVPVEVVNGIGAGDAFGGALCHGLLAGWDLRSVIRFGNAAGAFVAARLACSDAMPTTAEVDDLLAGQR